MNRPLISQIISYVLSHYTISIAYNKHIPNNIPEISSIPLYGSVSKPCTPVVHIKIAGKWMFIP